jgi:hypothetical protein
MLLTRFLLPTPVSASEPSSSFDSSEVRDSDKVEWDIDAIESEYLSNVWRISFEDAKRIIDVTSQLSVTPKDPILAKNYGTNDRMLRYKRI